MPDIITYCPRCRAQLTVQEAMIGQQAMCPMCRAIFVAQRDLVLPTAVTPRTPEMPSTTEPPVLEEEEERPTQVAAPQTVAGTGMRRRPEPVDDTFEAEEYDRRPRPRRRAPYGETPEDLSRRKRVARLFLWPVAFCLIAVALMGLMANACRILIVLFPAPNSPDDPEWLQQIQKIEGEPWPVGVEIGFSAVMILTGLVVIISAIQMMRLKMYWLAFVGPAAALLNLTFGCCILALPASICAIVFLLLPNNRKAFD